MEQPAQGLSASTKQVLDIVRSDACRMEILKCTVTLGLPHWWIGAGFVRNAVWDKLHGFSAWTVLNDVDVIYFDVNDTGADKDVEIERELRAMLPHVNWSVKNQARMHGRSKVTPFVSVRDAVAGWTETATAVAVSVDFRGELALLAPLGVEDLLALLVKPTPYARSYPDVYRTRIKNKRWQHQWPRLQIEFL